MRILGNITTNRGVNMKSFDQVVTEEKMEELAVKIIGNVCDKVKNIIADELYNELARDAYEHYSNFKDRIEWELICDISHQFINDPKRRKYDDLRKKLWEENKEKMVLLLNDAAIFETIKKYMLRYTHKDEYFHWQWLDGIAWFICDHWDKFKDDPRVNDILNGEFARNRLEIENLKKQINQNYQER